MTRNKAKMPVSRKRLSRIDNLTHMNCVSLSEWVDAWVRHAGVAGRALLAEWVHDHRMNRASRGATGICGGGTSDRRERREDMHRNAQKDGQSKSNTRTQTNKGAFISFQSMGCGVNGAPRAHSAHRDPPREQSSIVYTASHPMHATDFSS